MYIYILTLEIEYTIPVRSSGRYWVQAKGCERPVQCTRRVHLYGGTWQKRFRYQGYKEYLHSHNRGQRNSKGYIIIYI